MELAAATTFSASITDVKVLRRILASYSISTARSLLLLRAVLHFAPAVADRLSLKAWHSLKPRQKRVAVFRLIHILTITRACTHQIRGLLLSTNVNGIVKPLYDSLATRCAALVIGSYLAEFAFVRPVSTPVLLHHILSIVPMSE
jgi:hypothetical protein